MRASNARLNNRGRGFCGTDGKSVSTPKQVVSVFEDERGSRGSTEVEESRIGSVVSKLVRGMGILEIIGNGWKLEVIWSQIKSVRKT